MTKLRKHGTSRRLSFWKKTQSIRKLVARKKWLIKRGRKAEARTLRYRIGGLKGWQTRLRRIDKRILFDERFYDPWLIEKEKYQIVDAALVDNARAFPIGAVQYDFELWAIRRGVIDAEKHGILKWSYEGVTDFWREFREVIRQARLDFAGEYDPLEHGLNMEFGPVWIETRP